MTNSADPDQLASQKPTDLDIHCLQRQGISGFSRTMVKFFVSMEMDIKLANCNFLSTHITTHVLLTGEAETF